MSSEYRANFLVRGERSSVGLGLWQVGPLRRRELNHELAFARMEKQYAGDFILHLGQNRTEAVEEVGYG